MLNLGKPAAIFDMDGTLIDSMPTWRMLNREFLEHRSLPLPAEMTEDFDTYPTRLCAEIYIRKFGLSMTVDEYAAANEAIMNTRYAALPAKQGVPEYIALLAQAGIRMIVATNTARPIAQKALESKGILQYFECILTPTLVGIPKSNPEFWNFVARHMMIEPSDMVVYEDTLAMIRSARTAGTKVVAVNEPVWRKHAEEIRSLSDIYISDFRDLLA